MQSIEAKIRKQQNILMYSGIFMIIFGIWSIIRIILMRYMDENQFLDLFSSIDDLSVEQIETICFMLLLAFLILDLCARLYVGLSALKEGRGLYKKHVTYIIVAFIYAVVFISYDIIFIFEEKFVVDDVIDAVLDITTNIATIKIVMASIRVRIYEKERISKLGANNNQLTK